MGKFLDNMVTPKKTLGGVGGQNNTVKAGGSFAQSFGVAPSLLRKEPVQQPIQQPVQTQTQPQQNILQRIQTFISSLAKQPEPAVVS